MNVSNTLALRSPLASRESKSYSLAIVTVIALALGLAGSAIGQNATITEVVGGLHSPRGLAFGPHGQLFVTEAGDDSSDGSIIEIGKPSTPHPRVRTVVSGLPSILVDEGEYVGVDGISVAGAGPELSLYVVMAESPQAEGNNRAFGSLLRVSRRGQIQSLTNVGYFDYKWTQRHSDLAEDFPDADPYAVLVLPDHTYVADAGSNTLDEVMADGSVRVLAYFPNETLSDAVPTCIAQGPDGLLYVGTLALVDSFFIGPSAKVYQLDPAQANLKNPTKTPMTVWASGLWPINGCAFGPDGDLYVSQLFTNPDILNDFENPLGDVVQIPFSDPATHTFLTDGALSWTGGVAVGPNSAVYAADGTAFVAPGAGRIVRLDR